MLILNKKINNNILIFYKDIIITNFIKTIIINKIKIIKKKRVIKNIKKKNIFYNIFVFYNFLKKIKFGYYIEKSNKIFLPNNLIGIKLNNFPKKIKMFEILFKILKYNNSLVATRKIYFKNKFLKKKLKVNNLYLGIIKNVVNYGVFIDIGKTDGLLHISDIPKSKKLFNKIFIKNLIIIKIVKFDKKIRKISLSLKKIYKRKNKKNINEIICCKIYKKKNNIYYCFDKLHNKYILKENLEDLKINDIVYAYLIKKKFKKSYISRVYRIKKNGNKFSTFYFKYKSEDLILCLRNLRYIDNFYKNKITKLSNNNYYKHYIFDKIKNEFCKVLKNNNFIIIKFGNIIFKIKNKINLFTIGKMFFFNNNIYFYIKNY